MINYSLIGKAIKKYKKLGYSYMEVPWMVGTKATYSTMPEDGSAFAVKGKYLDDYLVGSAEQSFVQLILDKKLKNGKYVAATPCFRDNPEDEYHQKTFFKVELIHYSRKVFFQESDLHDVLADALTVLSGLTDKKIKTVKTNIGYDLEIDGIEIGSYGIRYFQGVNWVYGTGLAEPRFSKVGL